MTVRALIVAFVLITVASAFAADGAPPELIGAYGHSPQQCQSFHRKTDNVSIISETAYTFCGGSACEATIISYTRKGHSYTLKLAGGWTTTLTEVDDGVFETSDGETLVRCTLKDQIRGIGLLPNTEGAVTATHSALFSALYAENVKTVCPDLSPDIETTATLVEASSRGWVKFLKTRGLLQRSEEDELNYILHSSTMEAQYALREDAEAIPEFCDHVLDAFGREGTIFPNLIADDRPERRKT